MRLALVLVASLAVPAALYACANDDNGPPGPKTVTVVDSSTGIDAADASIDQAPQARVHCTQAELDAVASPVGGDYTAPLTPIEIVFPSAAGPQQYTNHCIKVKIGATVTFKGSFSNHPLKAAGGDVPSPIPAVTTADQDAGSLALTLTTPGTFGFECGFHPGLMFGGIQVVP